MRSVGIAVLGFCALAAICAGVARATGGGGDSIATALPVTAGVQEQGDTSTQPPDSCGNGFEFWTLQLEQGDLVAITWAAPPAVDTLELLPAGTTDAAHGSCLFGPAANWSASPVLSDSNGTPATPKTSQVVVPSDGSYPLLFLDTTGQNAGAYNFTAVVLHAAFALLPPLSTIPGTGTLTASVVAPDSDPIRDPTLNLTLNGYWRTAAGAPLRSHRLATATPADGNATFSYSLPGSVWGKKIRIDISGGGGSSSYQPVTSAKDSVKVNVPTGAPVAVSLSQLKAASKVVRQPIYWAGRRKGLHYEFTRTENGYAYVRYLPHGVLPGDPRSKFLIVATYPVPGAYGAVKKYAKGKAVAGPHGSIYFVRPRDRRSVLVAFPKIDDEIEIYDPSPAVARAIAASGRVRPVR